MMVEAFEFLASPESAAYRAPDDAVDGTYLRRLLRKRQGECGRTLRPNPMEVG